MKIKKYEHNMPSPLFSRRRFVFLLVMCLALRPSFDSSAPTLIALDGVVIGSTNSLYLHQETNNATTYLRNSNEEFDDDDAIINIPDISVLLTFKKSRRDRMGSRLQEPFSGEHKSKRHKLNFNRMIHSVCMEYTNISGSSEWDISSNFSHSFTAWLVAHYHRWKFCGPPDPMAQALSFPMCNNVSSLDYVTRQLLEMGASGSSSLYEYHNDDNITQSGIYYINENSNKGLWDSIYDTEKSITKPSMFTQRFIRDWRGMILNAHIRPEIDKELWLHPDSIRIAVHVRRGDILPGVRNDVWISDDQIISLIEMSIHYTRWIRGPDVKTEVHVFSEGYGMTNWTRYGSLVDQYHLAPEGSEDIELNLRDWKHFVNADVLIVGGTFSALPAFARSHIISTANGNNIGFPITIYRDRGMKGGRKDWIPWRYSHEEVVARFPTGTITAKLGMGSKQQTHVQIHSNTSTTPLSIETMMAGLCKECKESTAPAYKCTQRIERYVKPGTSYADFEDVQRQVSQKVHCSSCNLDTCRVRIAKDSNGNLLQIDSVIGIQYVQSCQQWALSNGLCLEDEYEYLHAG